MKMNGMPKTWLTILLALPVGLTLLAALEVIFVNVPAWQIAAWTGGLVFGVFTLAGLWIFFKALRDWRR